MDTVKTLIQSVTRGFYDLRSMLIIDALLVHSALSDDELMTLLGIQRKDLRATCLKLKEDHMLTDHIQRVERPNQRPMSKTYYYIHYTETVDAIKWKMHSIVKKLKEQMGADAQPQGYICDKCKTKFSQMDAVTMFSPARNEFVCDVCHHTLRQDDSGAENQANQQKLGHLMQQVQPIIDTLRQLDERVVPENTFASSFAQQVPVDTESARPTFASNALPTSGARAGDGSINGAAQYTVNITSEAENAEIERKQKEEKERMAAENALPSWHVESTVGKNMDAAEVNSENGDVKLEGTEEAADTSNAAADNDKDQEEALAAYYAQLAAQQAEEEEEEEEEDDEEEEFEEVELQE